MFHLRTLYQIKFSNLLSFLVWYFECLKVFSQLAIKKHLIPHKADFSSEP